MKLVANIIGDVLTSLAKPLGDLQYLFCYLRYAAAAAAAAAATAAVCLSVTVAASALALTDADPGTPCGQFRVGQGVAAPRCSSSSIRPVYCCSCCFGCYTEVNANEKVLLLRLLRVDAAALLHCAAAAASVAVAAARAWTAVARRSATVSLCVPLVGCMYSWLLDLLQQLR